MGQSLEEVIAELPAERQERIEARYRELKQDVETLRELRKLAGKAQAEIAHSLKISQPSVSKIERGRTCCCPRFGAMWRRPAERSI